MAKPVGLVWDGITRSATLSAVAVRERHELLDKAKSGDWGSVLALIKNRPSLINVARPDGEAGYAPLHHAAYQGAPVEVVQQLVDLGAWRTLRTSQGERPVDIATNRGYVHLVEALAPVLRHRIPEPELQMIQRDFHQLIRTWGQSDDGQQQPVLDLVLEHQLRLPELEPLLEYASAVVWFGVPGMYGGFRYWLKTTDGYVYLVVDSWSRVGSGPFRHLVSTHGSLLVDNVHAASGWVKSSAPKESE